MTAVSLWCTVVIPLTATLADLMDELAHFSSSVCPFILGVRQVFYLKKREKKTEKWMTNQGKVAGHSGDS